MVDISFSKASILLSKLCTELCIPGLGVSGLVPEIEKKFQVSFPWKSNSKDLNVQGNDQMTEYWSFPF